MSRLIHSFLGLGGGDIQVGVNRNMADCKRNGVAWVRERNGGINRVPFMVDKPGVLHKPGFLTIRTIFNQLEKMGLETVNLEIFTVGQVRVYKNGQCSPVLVQSH